MPIREPKYIIQAKEKLSKSVNTCITKRQHITIESVDEEEKTKNKKRLKCNNISTEKSITISTAVIEPDDCIIVSHITNYIPTAHEMASRRRVLDERQIPLSSVKENVLSKYSKLNDDSLDIFLRILVKTSCFETQSVHYIEYPELIIASDRKSIQILGGNCTDHWRCIFFDETKLYVYDSIWLYIR